MWETLGTVRDLGRLQEIAAVLIRYGFGDLVRRIGLADVLERAGRLLHWGDDSSQRLPMTAPNVRPPRQLTTLSETYSSAVSPR